MGFVNTAGMKKRNSLEYMEAILQNTSYANSEEYKNNLNEDETASKIRDHLINKEGEANRQKMRRKYKDIIMLDNAELVSKYSYLIDK